MFRVFFLILILPCTSFAQECFHPDGQPYVNHWLACNDTVVVERAKNEAAKETITQWSARALLCEAALEAQDSSALICDERGDFVDGGGNRLWKPKSDNTGLPVFLLPSRYFGLLPNDSVDRVKVYSAETGEEITGRDSFRQTEDGANGDRYHHDVKIGGSEALVIQLERSDGVLECLNVPNASQRYD